MSKNTDQKHSKNYIQPKYTDSMTELGQQEAVKSTNFKSETKLIRSFCKIIYSFIIIKLN